MLQYTLEDQADQHKFYVSSTKLAVILTHISGHTLPEFSSDTRDGVFQLSHYKELQIKEKQTNKQTNRQGCTPSLKNQSPQLSTKTIERK